MIMKILTKDKRGLTLIETLVAISVLMVAVSGALSLSYKSLSSASFAKDQITAYYLAQDGMESVKNLRDDQFLSGSGNWTTPFGPCGTNAGCTIDPINLDVAGCGTGGCDPLRFDDATGLYSYNNPSLPQSIYARTIEISGNGANERLVTVTVRWRNGMVNKTFVVKETIFNWYE